jgi:hypothetical protein
VIAFATIPATSLGHRPVIVDHPEWKSSGMITSPEQRSDHALIDMFPTSDQRVVHPADRVQNHGGDPAFHGIRAAERRCVRGAAPDLLARSSSWGFLSAADSSQLNNS